MQFYYRHCVIYYFRKERIIMNIKDKIRILNTEKEHKTSHIEQYQASIERCKERLPIIDEEIKQLKQQGGYDKMWKPAPAEDYFYINRCGEARKTHYEGTQCDTWRRATSNQYQTEYHCKKAIEAEKLKGEIREFARVENGEWRVDWEASDLKHTLHINNDTTQVSRCSYPQFNDLKIIPILKTSQIADKAIEKFGKRILELQAYI